ncbi:MAG: type II secretion system protein [Planctomycetota bacterium]
MADRWLQREGRRAFTLVELLVVVAIIGILVSLLLPSFRQFREHARTVACQTQMAALDKGLINYALDLDAFPITADPTGKPVSWRYGGWTGNNLRLKSYEGGVYYIPTGKRPLSVYMFRSTPLGEETRLPAFHCPSDVRTWWAGPTSVAASETPAYENFGTSYNLNWQWFATQTVVPGLPYGQNRLVHRVPRGERLWWKYMQQNVSRFVTLLENPADFALTHRLQLDGNHRKFSKHNFAFLDGHVEYVYADTHYLHERGWTVVDETPPYKEWWPD